MGSGCFQAVSKKGRLTTFVANINNGSVLGKYSKQSKN